MKPSGISPGRYQPSWSGHRGRHPTPGLRPMEFAEHRSNRCRCGVKVCHRWDRGDTRHGTWGWHAAAPAVGCQGSQVAMETSRRDAVPINSQFKVILLKELFYIYVCEQVPPFF